MSIEVSFRIEEKTLMCYIAGRRTSSDVLRYWREMLNKCREEKLSKMLVTIALQGTFDRFEAIEVYQSLINILQFTNVTIAVIDLNELSATDSKMACQMALAYDINVYFAETEAEAKSWLKSQSPSTLILPPIVANKKHISKAK